MSVQGFVDTRDGRPRCHTLPASALGKAICAPGRDWLIVPARRPPIGEIVAEVARRRGSTSARIMVKTRKQSIYRIRAEAMLVCALTGYSKRRIAQFFKQDRSTVSHAIRQALIERKLEAL